MLLQLLLSLKLAYKAGGTVHRRLQCGLHVAGLSEPEREVGYCPHPSFWLISLPHLNQGADYAHPPQYSDITVALLTLFYQVFEWRLLILTHF